MDLSDLERWDATFCSRQERTDDALILRLQGKIYQLHHAGTDVLIDKLEEDEAIYRVTPDGRCNCPDAVFRRRECKHVKALRQLQLVN